MSGDTIVAVDRLTKRYGQVTALDGFDLEVTRGEVHGFLGPNGAGKTTTLRILLGMVAPTSGTATVFGLDPRHDAVAIHRRLAYVPGDVALWPSLTGGEVIDLLGRLGGQQLDQGRRDELVARFELDPTRRCRTYSKGNRQKVALVAAFALGAELLVLDEPTSGLDPLMEEVFRQTVREAADQGATVLLSSHILSEVEALCDRATIVRSGTRVTTATLADLRGAHHVELAARLGHEPDLTGIPGLTELSLTADGDGDGHELTCRAAPEALDEVLARLAAAHVLSLTCTPPSLEESFLAHYEPTGSPA